jgi:hypothetical protein
VTGDQVIDRMIRIAGLTARDLRRAVRRHREALNADHPKYGTPDHVTRLEAAKALYELAGLRGQKRVRVTAKFAGPLVIRWDTSASSPSPTPPDACSAPSTTPSSGSAPAPPSSSSTDALESL